MAEHYGPPSGTAPKTGAGLVRVRLFYDTPTGDVAENVFGINRNTSAPPTTAELTDICNKFSTWWQQGNASHSHKAVTGLAYSLASVTAKDLNIVDGQEVGITVGVAGTDSGGALAAGLTFATTLRTGRTGRSHRGRSFIVGPTVNCLLSGSKDSIDPTWASNLTAAYGGMLAGAFPVNVSGRTLCILSYSNGNAYRTEIAATDVASFGTSDLFLDYQRRRAPAHSRHF